MKYLITFFLLISVAYGQWVPMASNYKYRGLKADSILGVPKFADTITPQKANGYVILVDSIFYIYYNKWNRIGGSTFDSTSLSNRINEKLSISDSGAMLVPYLKRIDSSLYQTKFGVDTLRSNIYSNFYYYLLKSDSAIYFSKYRSDTMRNNIYLNLGTKINISDTANKWVNDIYRQNGTDSIYFKIGSTTYAIKDSVGGSTSGFVPYTGASQDLDMGANGITAKFYKVTGTAGNGHIDFKHQSGNPSAQGNSTLLYADANGWLKLKNDNFYYSTLKMSQTADRTFTFQNKSYTLGDSADIELRLKYSDTASLLAPYVHYSDSTIYQTKFRVDTMRSNVYNSINSKLNLSDSATYFTKYRSDTMRTNVYGTFSGYHLKSDSVTYQSKYRVDTMRTNIYSTLNGKLNTSDSSIYFTKFRSDSMRTNIYAGINGKQNQLNGTGFITASGTTISYDNSTYVSTSSYEWIWTTGMQALGSTIKGINLGIPVFYSIGGAAVLTSTAVRFVPYYLPKAETITGVKFYQATAGNYTGNNYNGVGLYSYSAGTLTLVASTTNSATFWQNSSNAWQTKPFSSTYSAAAGVYYLGLMYSNSAQTTAPQLLAGSTVNNNFATIDFTNSAKVAGVSNTGLTALPSSITMSNINTTTNLPSIYLY